MIGKKLVTKQTGAAGRACNAVRPNHFFDFELVLRKTDQSSINRLCLQSDATRLMSTTLLF